MIWLSLSLVVAFLTLCVALLNLWHPSEFLENTMRLGVLLFLALLLTGASIGD